MTPLHELLSRIRWDPVFVAAEFVLGYWDRVARRVLRVPLRDVDLDPADHFAFRVADRDGRIHEAPFHRVVEACRNGRIIWQRRPRSRGTS